MQKKNLITVVIIALLAVITIVGGLASGVLDKDDEAAAQIAQKGLEEIYDDINKSGAALEDEALIPYAAAILDKADSLSDKGISDSLSNTENSLSLKCILLQVASGTDIKISKKTIEKIVCDNTEEHALRRNALDYAYINLDDAEIMINCINTSTDERLSYHAIKYLYQLAPAEGVDYALKNLPKGDEDLTYITKGATEVIAKAIKEGCTDMPLKDFLVLCDKVLAAAPDNKNTVNTIFFAIAQVQQKESIDYIISAKLLDADMKWYLISRNADFVITMLDNTDTIDTALSAIAVFPDLIFEKPLKNAALKFPEYSEQINELLKSCTETIF